MRQVIILLWVDVTYWLRPRGHTKSLHISVLDCVIITVKIVVNGMFLRGNTISKK